MHKMKYAVIGGDLRSVKLANLINEDGNEVDIFGFDNAGFDVGLKLRKDMASAISGKDVVIGPIPCSNDNETINAPFNNEKLYINEVFKTLSKNQLFIAGRISDRISQMAKVYNIYSVDLLEREEMAVLNAIPTAEGAIQLAMEEMPITLHQSKALILGFGRIGKTLAKMLLGIGADVHVAARKYSDIAWINSYNYTPILFSEINDYISGMDVVFNTVPQTVLDEELLKAYGKEKLIIDLASKPGGVDFEKAKTIGTKVIWALSLPGKVAPVSAAKFIKSTVYNIINELGV